MKIVILTGNEIRHQFFRKKVAKCKSINVLASFCEGTEKSLENSVLSKKNYSSIELLHVKARTQSENDFFKIPIEEMKDFSNPKFIPKGDINEDEIVDEILELKPDLLVCYGSSIIRSKLLNKMRGKFINVHLGLSPYYRGSGTNVWPLINNEPEFVGATFMYINEGIDTGKIIHQIRADIMLGDSPHSIGNRLISKMTDEYIKIIQNFDNLSDELQISTKGKLYLQKHFDEKACLKLYDNFKKGLVEKFLRKEKNKNQINIIKNKALI